MKYIIPGVINLGIGLALTFAILIGCVMYTPTYKYKIYFHSDYDNKNSMERLGSEGWEIIAARRAMLKDEPGYEFILKK